MKNVCTPNDKCPQVIGCGQNETKANVDNKSSFLYERCMPENRLRYTKKAGVGTTYIAAK